MSPRAANTREQIIDRARELLQTRGLDGFSYRDISTHLGIKNAAVHYHFPSKTDLGLALVQEFTDEIRKDIEMAAQRGIPPAMQLEVYFNRAEREVEEGWCICPFGALAASYERLPEDVQTAVDELRKLVHGWLGTTLQSGRKLGLFRFDGSADAKAVQIAAALQGARQLSQMVGCNVVRAVIDQYRQELYVSADEDD